MKMTKKWFVQIGILLIASLLGAMGGIQYVNEFMGISKPTPLEQIETVEETAPTTLNPREDLVKKQEMTEEQHYNFFSETAMSGATSLESLSRNLLNSLIHAIDSGLNGREE